MKYLLREAMKVFRLSLDILRFVTWASKGLNLKWTNLWWQFVFYPYFFKFTANRNIFSCKNTNTFKNFLSCYNNDLLAVEILCDVRITWMIEQSKSRVNSRTCEKTLWSENSLFIRKSLTLKFRKFLVQLIVSYPLTLISICSSCLACLLLHPKMD